ncbi:hypothetical protein [Nonomuraea insulae]|uniref:Excreted virulence factor EspC (Type VII ESX diderm) n=1 Tax=Nonomuraea insulae TaxID=1616787 RepID=A0ABW1CQE9_9ACTN
MGTDRGVDLSRRAIKAARTDLAEALALLSPDKENGGTATPVLTPEGKAASLSSDFSAIGFYWPAAMNFHQSASNGIRAVSSSYSNIVLQLQTLIQLFDQALRNYDGVEVGSEDRSGQVRV